MTALATTALALLFTLALVVLTRRGGRRRGSGGLAGALRRGGALERLG
jgi:hypothetical protein